MTSTIIVNVVLDAIVLGAMLALLGWAIKTQWRDLPAAAAAERRRQPDRRVRATRRLPQHAERRRAERRSGRTITA
ncbi:MAG: hypothetical protein WCB67_16835 [Solirubrobacteraceae bacterium]